MVHPTVAVLARARAIAAMLAMAVLIALIVTNCAGPPTAPAPEPVDGDLPAARDLGYQSASLADLRQGRELFVANCQRCHDLPDTTHKTPAQWPRVVSVMGDNTDLTDPELVLVRQYLQTMSARAAQSQPAR